MAQLCLHKDLANSQERHLSLSLVQVLKGNFVLGDGSLVLNVRKVQVINPSIYDLLFSPSVRELDSLR